MSPNHLLRSQTDEVFRAIESAGFAPPEFTWRERDGAWAGWVSEQVPELRHNASGFYISFAQSPDNEHEILYSPARNARMSRSTKRSWAGVMEVVREWIQYLKRELNAPGLWEQLKFESDALNAAADADMDNRPFSSGERSQVIDTMTRLRAAVLRSQLLEAGHTKLLLSRIDDLEEAAGRVGRKDWYLMFMGAILGTVLGLGTQPNAAREVLSLAGAAFRALIEALRLLQLHS